MESSGARDRRRRGAERLYSDAVVEIQKANDPKEPDPNFMATLGHVYAMEGRREEARRLLDQLGEESKKSYVSSYHAAVVYAGLGDKDEAFKMLDQATQERSTLLVYLRKDPRLMTRARIRDSRASSIGSDSRAEARVVGHTPTRSGAALRQDFPTHADTPLASSRVPFQCGFRRGTCGGCRNRATPKASGRSVVAYPVGGQSIMSYSLEKAGYVVVRVYDVLGRLVRRFAEDHPSGTYGIMWDGRLGNGRPAPRGTYFYRLTLPNGKETVRKTDLQ